jgi:hypothetical protein
MNPHPSHLRRLIHRRPVLVLAVIGCMGIPSTAWGAAQDGPTRLHVSKQERLHELEQAQLFIARETNTLDLRAGPVDGLTFDPAAVVACEYHLPGARLGGATPKFLCRIGGTVYKVKYLPSARYGTARKNGGSPDREIYAEMAATRLFWALGFGADRVFLTNVVCHGCPASPHDGPDEREQRTRAYSRSARPIGIALIEQRFEGATIAAGGQEGWTWSELHEHVGRARASNDPSLTPSALSSPSVREQAEALQLLQVFVQHGDCKPEQQRLVCLPGSAVRKTSGATATPSSTGPSQDADADAEADALEYVCRSPFALVDDLGATFGGAGAFTGSGAKMSLSHWAKKPVFDPVAYRETGGACRGVLTPSLRCSGGIENPVITEAGRQFLLNRLGQLSDAQLHDLFVAARVTDFCDDAAECSVEAWVAVFKDKVRQIATHTCRDASTTPFLKALNQSK